MDQVLLEPGPKTCRSVALNLFLHILPSFIEQDYQIYPQNTH